MRILDGRAQTLHRPKDTLAFLATEASAFPGGERAAIDALLKLAQRLVVDPEALVALGINWSKRHRAWSFPMRNWMGEVVGIRYRCPRSGRKWSEPGCRSGVFIAPMQNVDPLLVTEGETDTAAALGMNFDVVGRPSCHSGNHDVCRLARRRSVVIIADNDRQGINGAAKLADDLELWAGEVLAVIPRGGAKDLREWRQAGLTREQLLDAIEDARDLMRLGGEG